MPFQNVVLPYHRFCCDQEPRPYKQVQKDIKDRFKGIDPEFEGPPYYLHDYPSFRKVQLPAVKKGIYHHELPTLRAISRNNTAGCLSDEHCQTSTIRQEKDFIISEPPAVRLPPCTSNKPDLSDIAHRAMQKHYWTQGDVDKSRAIWKRQLSTSNELEGIEDKFRNFTKEKDPNKVFTWDGVRTVLKEKVFRDPRLTFKDGPCLRQRTQQPTDPHRDSMFRERKRIL